MYYEILDPCKSCNHLNIQLEIHRATRREVGRNDSGRVVNGLHPEVLAVRPSVSLSPVQQKRLM